MDADYYLKHIIVENVMAFAQFAGLILLFMWLDRLSTTVDIQLMK